MDRGQSVAGRGSRRAGVLGHPIAHSLSPVLHRAAYEALGLDWTYDAHDVTAEQLPTFFERMGEEWVGLSLTMPLKAAILPLLDFVEPMAKVLGAVNTVVFDREGPGRLAVGANTDVYGIKGALGEGGVREVARGVVLGGGATATSAIAAFAELGCRSPVVVVRERSRAGGLIRAAAKAGIDPQLMVFTDVEHVNEALGAADAVVSTIPAQAGAGVTLPEAHPGGVLLDAVYEPLETPLLRGWAAIGGIGVNGSRMLLHQAGEQVRLMTGYPAPVAAMDNALVKHLSHEPR